MQLITESVIINDAHYILMSAHHSLLYYSAEIPSLVSVCPRMALQGTPT